ncbi:uncharacterized protein BDZ83DRAFT_638888 [Colletotrichum acutatum]|uniref:Uncharacterized protein n=1 Tax=Glomerella acutata TaxID=27357 RepID=A0AAD8XAN4_GLOAC|nr:uncharacterized protein BDZ83DRAFT_638888 [Colletotrichum acutatum]KAK1712203.1 hypothetical protein BDZ83DRAFT_638888 [Colletotrichum acutatum]
MEGTMPGALYCLLAFSTITPTRFLPHRPRYCRRKEQRGKGGTLNISSVKLITRKHRSGR